MAWVFLILWLATLALLVRPVPVQRMVAQAASLKRVVDSRHVHKQALELSETDRLIREQEHEMLPHLEHKHLNCSICGPGPLKQGLVPSKYQHPMYRDVQKRWDNGYSSGWVKALESANVDTAKVVSSRVIQNGEFTGMHTIMLDFDFPVTVIESTSQGHFHFYADQLVTWKQYKRLLRALRDAGLIEEGYYNASISQRATHLRPPWVKKVNPGGIVPKPPRGAKDILPKPDPTRWMRRK